MPCTGKRRRPGSQAGEGVRMGDRVGKEKTDYDDQDIAYFIDSGVCGNILTDDAQDSPV